MSLMKRGRRMIRRYTAAGRGLRVLLGLWLKNIRISLYASAAPLPDSLPMSRYWMLRFCLS